MKRVILAVWLLALVGCASSTPTTATTPAPPNSPQTQAMNIDKALADAVNAAVKTAISLRNAGTISQADTTTIELWARSVAASDDAIATELGSADPWATQRQKILLMLPLFKIPGTSAVDTTLQAALSAVSALLTQLQGAVQ